MSVFAEDKTDSKKHLSLEENEKIQECLLGLKQDILSSIWVDKSDFVLDLNKRASNAHVLVPAMEQLRREMEDRYCIRCESSGKGRYLFYSGRPQVLPRYMRESPLHHCRRMTL